MERRVGFTLIELMIVVAIIGILAVVAVPKFTKFIAKAKRTEAYVHLHALYAEQKAYQAEHGTYTNVLSGPSSLGWKPEGDMNYTYGFGGSEGRNYFTGKLGTDSSHLRSAYADANGFLILAAGTIAGSDKPDILAIDQNNTITIVQDALQ